MSDLQTLYQAIDRLKPDELAQLRDYIERRRHMDTKARIAALKAALAEFREGISPAQWDEMAKAMNVENVEPEDPTLFDWIDDLPEDRR
jgi:hypothetical protein